MHIKSLPSVIDLRILGACNLQCPFCFGPRHKLGPASTTSLLDVIAKLPVYGVQSIVVTGGEPVLVRELPLLLKTAKQLGLKTVLSTNGILFREKIADIAPYLDWIGLPLDGDCKEINQKMRVGDPQHYETILELIPLIRQKYPQLRIKLGTVVCAINKHHVTGIPDVVSDIRRPDIWKLYEIAYSSYGKDNKNLLQLSDEEFEQIFTQAQKSAQKHGILTTNLRRSMREKTYLFLEPTGDAIAVSQNEEVVIGNFFSDFEHVVSSWNNFVDPEKMDANFIQTYPD